MPTIGAFVDQQLKDEFRRLADSRTTSESRLAGAWIAERLRREMGLPAPPVVPVVLPDRHAPRTEQVFVRLAPYYYAELLRLAAEREWKPGTFMSQMFMAHADRRPALCQPEIDALRPVARYLADMGRNINQVARKLNSSQDEAYHVFSLELDKIAMLIDLEATVVRDLLRANVKGWGMGDGEQ